MSDLENSMAAIIDVFHKYSGKEGDKHKLKKSELKDLINNELASFLGIWDPALQMSDLENSMAAIIDVFHKYSGKEGDKHKLKKSELKDLINNELASFLGQIKDQATMDSLMESLDTDADSECDFQEFMTFIAMVTIGCHEFFEHHEDE
ncbi:Protein S100-B [Acipenser ruthenus]|uniref:Protein S100-B n=1 Tax=Acipenser ruthenus TaxID=7906 RepID=A0A662YPM2_ACIRT|nr:Protein S100-B [Acipenser ruthenus]